MLFGVISFCSAKAQVLWDFRGGVSYNTLGGYTETTKDAFSYMGELGIDIPIKDKFGIEVALRYKNIFHSDSFKSELDYDNLQDYDKYYWLNKENCEGRASILELPLRMGYKIPIFSNTLLRVGVGPYVSAGLNDKFRLYQAGISTALTYEYKKINIGVNYNLALHDSFEREGHNGVFLTFGVKFKSSAWKSIGAAAAAVGSVAVVVSNAITTSETNDNSTSIPNDETSLETNGNDYADDNSNANDYAKRKNEAKKKELDEKSKKAKKELDYRRSGGYKNDDRAYGGYEDELRKMKLNPERYTHLSTEKYCRTVKDIQSQMKTIRERMARNGCKRAKSSLESWNPCK